jgi:hypothetical protein
MQTKRPSSVEQLWSRAVEAERSLNGQLLNLNQARTAVTAGPTPAAA